MFIIVYEFVIWCLLDIKLNQHFSADFSGSMQHYHKVIFTEDPEPDPKPEPAPELKSKHNDSDIIDMKLSCGKSAAIKLKL